MSLYYKRVPVFKNEPVLIFLTIRYRFLQLSEPVPVSVYDRPDLPVLNQLEI